MHSQAFAAASIHGDKARPNKKPVLLLTFVIILHAWLCLLMIMFVICTCWYPYWSRPADTAPEMPPKAPERTRPPAPHLLNISGAERSEPNRRRKSVTFRRRPLDFPAPETTCLCGLTFSGAVMGNFRRWRLLVLSYFWRRPGDFPAPGTTCMCGLIVFRRRPGYFPAPTSFILSVHILPLP